MDAPPRSPKAGQDYPQAWTQFLDWFSTDEACSRYLERLRWPDGFVCPRCAEKGEPYRANRARLMCRVCKHQCSVTAGTLFDKTRTPLRTWLAGAWYVTSQKQGVNALGMQRVLGLASYETAWTMLHRFRRAMTRPGRELLKGNVEVDETFIAITDRINPPSVEGRKSHTTDTLVAMAVEVVEPLGFGRVRFRRIPDDTERSVLPFIREEIAPGSTLHTDGSATYRSVTKHGYKQNRNVMLGSITPAHVSLPGVHRVASLVKRWLLGTHHGAVQPDQLDYYLDEFAFRFNRRSSRSRGLLFYRLLEQAVATPPVTYSDIAGGRSFSQSGT